MENRRLLIVLALGLGLTLALGLLVSGGRAAPSTPLWGPINPVTNPVANTHTAPPTTTVSITYDEPISPTTVSTQTFAVHAMQTGMLTETYGVYSGTISLTPTQPFKPGELVQVSATTGTLSLVDGTGPVSPTVWQFRIAVEDGLGRFADSGQNLGSSDSAGVALGDVDGDGDLDGFVANGGGQADKVWLNDGTGVFTEGQGLGGSDSVVVVLGDLDGDGDLDGFVANGGGQPNKVYLNDGAGVFTEAQDLGSSNSVAGALGDLDGDGDLDAFVANYHHPAGQPNKVWLNDGGIQGGTPGVFSDSGQSLGTGNSHGVALGDLDGDGDLDAFVANVFDQVSISYANKVWLNDGAGAFTETQSLGSSVSAGVALGDLDGDGDLDAFVVNTEGGNRVWLNDGTGGFSDSGQSLGGYQTKSWNVVLGDVDADGDLDAFVAKYDSQANTVWVNDGTGVFAEAQGLGSSDSRGVALGDVDGDGDLDAFVANSGANVVWLNLDQVVYLPLVLRNFP